MDGSVEGIIFFPPVWPPPETAMDVPCNSLVGALPYTLRDLIIPFVWSQGSLPRINDVTRPPAVVTAKQHLGCLALAVIGVFDGIVANPRHPNLQYVH